jgi:sugar phosphate isomerase/epimerase
VLQHNIGIQLASLRQPLKKALHTAARLGARGVEIDARDEMFLRDLSQSALRQLRKMMDDLNLQVCAVSFQTRRGYDTPDQLDRRLAATMRAQRLAYELRAPVVVNQVGTVPQQSEGPAWDLLIDSLTELGRHGQHIGALLAAETGSESGTDLRRLIEAVPGNTVVVDLNPAKLILNGFSPREATEQLGRYVAHAHASDGVRDLARRRAIEVTLGRGSAEIPELLGLLENYQYRGFWTVERQSAEDPVREVRMAVEYLTHL